MRLGRKNAAAIKRSSDAYFIATIIPSSIIVGYLMGLGVDWLFGCKPWGSWIGGGLGIIAGLYEAIRIAIRVGAEEDKAALGGSDEDDGQSP